MRGVFARATRVRRLRELLVGESEKDVTALRLDSGQTPELQVHRIVHVPPPSPTRRLDRGPTPHDDADGLGWHKEPLSSKYRSRLALSGSASRHVADIQRRWPV